MNIGNDQYHAKQEELQSKIEIQERVLKSYEKAVYENIGQILSLAKMNLSIVDLENMNESRLEINNSSKLIGKAINDLRYITKQLSPADIIEKGFAFAIEYELQRINYLKNCETEFSLSGSFFRLDEGKELMVFNILQELVLDLLILQVNKLVAELYYSADEIEIKIIHQNRDAGSLTKESITSNIKLNNRLKLVGAELNIDSLHGNEKISITIKRCFRSPGS